MGADIRDDNIVLPHESAHILQNLLRFHRKSTVLAVALVLLHHFLLQLQELHRLPLRLAAVLDLLQGIGNIADDLRLRLEELIDMGGAGINMDDGMAALCIPFPRRKLHDVVPDRNHQIRHVDNFILIVLLGNADCPHGIFVGIGNDALRHHGIDRRNM